MRLIVRRVQPSRRRIKNLTDFERSTGWVYSVQATNIGHTGIGRLAGTGTVQFLDVLHRHHAVVEDRVRGAKACGLRLLPSQSWAVNESWIPAANLAADLDTWLRLDHEVSPEPVLSTGTTETGEITILDHAHGGLGLTGAGAPGVALSAIWSALASGATVIIDNTTASRLGLHTEDIALPPELRVVDESEDLAEAVRLTQSRVEYEPDTDTLAQRSTIIVTDRATAEQFATCSTRRPATT